jgi:endonuclease/exonuclease/phosphatase family metal-dependent hydrolase
MRLLTWNLHAGHGGRAAAQAAAIAGADVAMLQEVVEGPGHADILAAAWPHGAFARARGRLGGGAQGNLLLARQPITLWTAHDISNHALERRVALHAVLGSGVHLIGLHLDLSGTGRNRQLARVAEIIARDVPRAAPLILAGDCNDWSHVLDRALVQHGFHEAHRAVHGRVARTWPARAPLLGLDRIYVRGFDMQDAGRLDGGGRSDHHGVWADLEVSRSDGAARR